LSGTKLANNFSILAAKLVVVLLISLLSTRAVLDNLGVEDYGIYAVLIGVVGLFGILNAALTTGTQRFIAIELGRQNLKGASDQFNQSVSLHMLVAIVVLVSGFGLNELIVDDFLVIPEERISVAREVFTLALISLALSILSVPFNAILYTNERMDIIAGLEVSRSIFSFIVAYSLYAVDTDKLLWFAVGYVLANVISFVVTSIIIFTKFKNFRFNSTQMLNFSGIKRVVSFSFWNLFGAMASIAQNQGLAVMLNIFYGPSINAALGISQQLFSQMSTLSATIMKSVIPQMIKKEGGGDRASLKGLSFSSSKYSFYLLLVVSAPFLYGPELVLSWWLVEVPVGAADFTRLIVLMVLVNQVTVSLIASIQAVGTIAMYQFIVGSILIIALPLTYFYITAGFPSESILMIYILIAVVAGVARVGFATHLVGITLKDWLKKVLMPIAMVVFALAVMTYAANYFLSNGMDQVTFIVLSMLFSVLSIYFFGLDKSERAFFWHYLASTPRRVATYFGKS
jgi:O-antigen/teichoic acid export membrane protein